MTLPASAHTDLPWRIHAIAPDFTLLDVWALDTPGGPDDLPRLARTIAATDETLLANPLVHALFSVRLMLGRLAGTRPVARPSTAPWSIRQRLPQNLREGSRGPDVITMVPFPSVYMTDLEWVAECRSRLVHMIQHVGWVQDDAGSHGAQLATLVLPRNVIGALYLRLIAPIRRHVIGPAMVSAIARDWKAHDGPAHEQLTPRAR